MIYVMSDIHGQRRRFDSVLEQIRLRPEDTLYVLGDVIDRNPEGIGILRQLLAMPNVRLLAGNHERMMLESLYLPCSSDSLRERYLNRWYRNGGKVTHDRVMLLPEELRHELFARLDSLPLSEEVTVNGTRFLLVHAAPPKLFKARNTDGKYATERDFALWYRFSPTDSHPCGETVIFGHSKTSHFQPGEPLRVWYGSGLIGIDCGCSAPEWDDPAATEKCRLACLRLDDGKEFYSEEAKV